MSWDTYSEDDEFLRSENTTGSNASNGSIDGDHTMNEQAESLNLRRSHRTKQQLSHLQEYKVDLRTL